MTTYESDPTGPVASGSLAAPHGGALNGERGADELRVDLSRLRTELGETVEALVDRLDVPARVQGKAREVTDRAKETAAQVVDQAQQKAQLAQQKAQEAGHLVAQKVPDVVRERSGRTAALAGVVVLVGLLVAGVLVRRSG